MGAFDEPKASASDYFNSAPGQNFDTRQESQPVQEGLNYFANSPSNEANQMVQHD